MKAEEEVFVFRKLKENEGHLTVEEFYESAIMISPVTAAELCKEYAQSQLKQRVILPSTYVVEISKYMWRKCNPDSKFSEPPSMIYEEVEEFLKSLIKSKKP